MPRLGLRLAALLLLALPLATMGGEAPVVGPVFAAGLSEGRSWGDLSGDTFPVHEQLVSVTSAALEGAWRFHRRWEAGVSVDLGHAPVAPTVCPPGATCWGWLGRAVGFVRLHAAPRLALDPWLSVGAGVVAADVRIVTTSQRWEGFEALRLEAGADLLRRERLSLGVFVSSSLDRITREVVHARGYAVETASIPNRSWHGWVAAGLRGTFAPRRGGGAP